MSAKRWHIVAAKPSGLGAVKVALEATLFPGAGRTQAHSGLVIFKRAHPDWRLYAIEAGDGLAAVLKVRDLERAKGRRVDNPTMVHQGIAQRPTFHLLDAFGKPLADLYVNLDVARKVGQAFADATGHGVDVKPWAGSGLGAARTVGALTRSRPRARNPKGGARIVYNKLLGGWYVVRGPHQTPLSGRFNTKFEAEAWLSSRKGNPTLPRRTHCGVRDDGCHVQSRRVLGCKCDCLPCSRAVQAEMAAARKSWGIPARNPKRARRTARPKRQKRPKAAKRAKSSGRKGNPGGVNRAVRTFRKWHDFDPSKVSSVRAPATLKRPLVELGEVPEIVYTSDKWTGKKTTYVHKTNRPRPKLVTGADGKGLAFVGGRVKVTRAGLVG